MSSRDRLLVRTPRGKLSRCMRHVNGLWTQRYNRLRGTGGPLFWRRLPPVLGTDALKARVLEEQAAGVGGLPLRRIAEAFGVIRIGGVSHQSNALRRAIEAEPALRDHIKQANTMSIGF